MICICDILKAPTSFLKVGQTLFASDHKA